MGSSRIVLLCLAILSLHPTDCNTQERFALLLPADSTRAPPSLQLDGQGRVFVAAGGKLLRLNRELVSEQTFTLSGNSFGISLSSGEEQIVVCVTTPLELMCTIHNSSDLESNFEPENIHRGSQALNFERISIFTTENGYYVGRFNPAFRGGTSRGAISLDQIYGLNGSNFCSRLGEYNITHDNFRRLFIAGFSHGSYAYFVVSDHVSAPSSNLRIMRLCHEDLCSEEQANGTGAIFSAVYEESIMCGGSGGEQGSVSVVENFAGTTGTGLLISRSSTVCLASVAEVDRVMDNRYCQCSRRGIGKLNVIWDQSRECSNVTVSAAKLQI